MTLTRQQKYAAAWLSFWALWMFVVATCGACRTAPIETARLDSIEARARAATVYVGSVCGTKPLAGSGVALDEHRVLTAAHVVGTCNDPIIVVDSAPAVLLALDTEADLAVLRTAKELAGGPPMIAPPSTGDGRVCIATATPKRDWKCGDMESVRDGILTYGIASLPGNSGAGVYDRWGRLIGIHTHRFLSRAAGYGTQLLRSALPGGQEP